MIFKRGRPNSHVRPGKGAYACQDPGYGKDYRPV